MKKIAYFILCMVLTMPLLAGAAENEDDQEPRLVLKRTLTLPEAAMHLAVDLDGQLAEQLGLPEAPARGQAMIVTTPVNLTDLETASPLSLLAAEEMAGWFTRMGYKVQEARKGRTLLFRQGEGELLLTRRTDLLEHKELRANVILAGTYTATQRHVRFNIRLIEASSNQVLAMSSQTLKLSRDVRQLLQTPGAAGLHVTPSVETRLDLARQF